MDGPALRFVRLEGKEDEVIRKKFVGYNEDGLVRVEPGPGWILGGRYEEDGHAKAIYNFELRNDDVWIASYPKTGNACNSVNF
jgi:hypothetical protein